MVFDAYDDYEQSERVQKWLRQNGVSIGVGVAVGLVAIFGWQQWRSHQVNHQNQASALYQQLQSELAIGSDSKADVLIAQLQKDHANSSYAVFAATNRAQHLAQINQLDKAQASLDWAASHATDTTLKALTQLQLARLQLARDKTSDALAILDHMPTDDFTSMTQELRGDVLVKLGRADDARKAYQAAASAQGKDAPPSGALKIKIDDLAMAGKQGA